MGINLLDLKILRYPVNSFCRISLLSVLCLKTLCKRISCRETCTRAKTNQQINIQFDNNLECLWSQNKKQKIPDEAYGLRQNKSYFTRIVSYVYFRPAGTCSMRYVELARWSQDPSSKSLASWFLRTCIAGGIIHVRAYVTYVLSELRSLQLPESSAAGIRPTICAGAEAKVPRAYWITASLHCHRAALEVFPRLWNSLYIYIQQSWLTGSKLIDRCMRLASSAHVPDVLACEKLFN
jgi:hypothetical protein